jgi:hypothetical protein
MEYLLKNPSVAAATPEIVVSGNINACPAEKKLRACQMLQISGN